MKRHVDILADDSFEGRAAGSRGGHAASGYVRQQLNEIGAEAMGDESIDRIFSVFSDFDTKAFDEDSPSPGQMEQFLPVMELMGLTSRTVDIPIPEILLNEEPYATKYPDGIIQKTIYEGGQTALAQRLMELKGDPVGDQLKELEENAVTTEDICP